MKKLIILTVISLVTMAFVAKPLLLSGSEITFQSLESKSTNSQAVFNTIKYFKKGDKDIWMMNQSHQGLNTSKDKVDRLAIVVEANKVNFYQFEPGDLEWDDKLLSKKIGFRVSCFICHSNGPRAIRPDEQGFKLSWANKIKIFMWNLRIKSYGPLVESELQKANDLKMTVPFKHRSNFDNELLEIATCKKCHNNDSWFSRGNLTRQNSVTISFMIKNKLMPPLGFHLTPSEKKSIEDFVNGF